ncbi:hypothetical protein [Caballeronia humi]|uniref:hypothetical protein n=1 Tax=Caballeronia humi TaxID=326474 RepID=UPI000ADD77FA|nr:hypothetical protein [Caballeronia humi]
MHERYEYPENGSAAPLFGLEDSVREVTMGRSFAELQALYDRMIWMDSIVRQNDHLSGVGRRPSR